MPTQASWVMRKFFKACKFFEKDGILEREVKEWDVFSIKRVYMKLRGDLPRVTCKRLVCNNMGAPKWMFFCT